MEVTIIESIENIKSYPKCKTVKDLRGLIEKDANYKSHTDIKEWKLFYNGMELDEKTELANLASNLTKQPYINLVKPPEQPRFDTKQTFITDTVHFLVRGSRNNYDVLAIRPRQFNSYETLLKYYFFGKQKFGFITNVQDGNIVYDVYELDWPQLGGYIMLWENPRTTGERRSTEVRYVTDVELGQYEVLVPRTVKTYQQTNMNAINTNMEEILNVIDGHSDQIEPTTERA